MNFFPFNSERETKNRIILQKYIINSEIRAIGFLKLDICKSRLLVIKIDLNRTITRFFMKARFVNWKVDAMLVVQDQEIIVLFLIIL